VSPAKNTLSIYILGGKLKVSLARMIWRLAEREFHVVTGNHRSFPGAAGFVF
jgi:hypothetical protein